MELFKLLAKLTLDTSEYDKEVRNVERSRIEISDPRIGLDTGEFDNKVDEIEGTEIADPESPELDLDTSEYSDSLKDAEDESRTFSDTVKSIFSEMKGVIAGLGIAAMVTGIVNTLKEGVALAKDHGDRIDKQSQKMGISAKAYQEWSYALELSGASIDDLNRGLRTWQQAVGNEEAVNKLSGAFEALGIDAEQAFKKIENGDNLDALLEQVMYGLADKSAGDRGWIAEALFGRNATQLNALLNQTSKDIKEAKEEANDLGMIMTDEEVKNAAAYADATTRLEGALKGIKEAFAADLLPVLTDAANTVAKIVAFFNPRLREKSLSEQFADSDKALAEELTTIEGTATAAETLADKLLEMGDTSKMTADQYAIWKGTAEELIRLVPSLGDVIDLETGQISANSEEIKENIKQWEQLAKEKALQTVKEEKYQEIVKKNQGLIDKTVEANAKAAAAEGERAEGLRKLNEVLRKYGFSELGENATIEDVYAAQSNATLNYEGDEYGRATFLSELTGAVNNWTTAIGAANAAQAEAEAAEAELEKGRQEYESWLAALERLYGSPEEQGGNEETIKNNEELSDTTKNVESEFNTLEGKTRSTKDAIAIMGDDTREATGHVSKFGELAGGAEGEVLGLGEAAAAAAAQLASIQAPDISAFWIGGSHAKGLWNVPFDNYPALLHRDEMVLTKSQARQLREGSGGTAEGFGEAIANAVSEAMSRVYVMMSGEKVGDLTTRRVRNNMNASSYSKLRALGG